MSRQLRGIDQLHRQLLPRDIPHRKGWQLAVHYSPGQGPGGDCYEVLPLANGLILFLIAHANGQDGAATALALMVRVVLHSCPLCSGVNRVPFCPVVTPLTQPPQVLLGYITSVLAENKLEEQFMTTFCGVLDPADGSFQYANAGHPIPRWWQAAYQRLQHVREAIAPPLGIDRQASYQSAELRIEPSDLLVLYSDSLITAFNKGDQKSGWETLDYVVREATPRGAEAVKSALLARVEDYLVTEANPEEITFVVIERKQET